MKQFTTLALAVALVLGITVAAEARGCRSVAIARVQVNRVFAVNQVVAVSAFNQVVVASPVFAVAAPAVEVVQSVVASPVFLTQPVVVQSFAVQQVVQRGVNVQVRVRR